MPIRLPLSVDHFSVKLNLTAILPLSWCFATPASKRTLDANTIRAACPNSVVVLGHFACGISGIRQQMLSIEPCCRSFSKDMGFNEHCHVYRNLIPIIRGISMIFSSYHICLQLKSKPNRYVGILSHDVGMDALTSAMDVNHLRLFPRS